jgi:hypothetical protein
MQASRRGNVAHSGLAACAGLLLCTLGGCGDDLYVMGELYEIEGEMRKHALSSCTPFDERGPVPHGRGGPGGSRDLVVEQRMAGDSFLVVVTSDDDEIARRKYGATQLESGERDEFRITTRAGRVYELVYWGGRQCDASPESE